MVAVAGQTYAGQVRSATPALIRRLPVDSCPKPLHCLSDFDLPVMAVTNSSADRKKRGQVPLGAGVQGRLWVAPSKLVPPVDHVRAPARAYR
jgi:hypothetical protein